MTNLRTTLLAAILLASSGAQLVASQAAQSSLFYERQTQVTTLGGQPAISASSATATLSAIAQAQASSHTSDASTSSATTASASSTGSGTTMSDAKRKELEAYWAQQELAREQEMKVRVDETTYNQTWSESLGLRQQKIAEKIYGAALCLPQDLIKLIAQYAYEFRGICTATIAGQNRCVKKICPLSDGRFASATSGFNIALINPSKNSAEAVLEQNSEFIGGMVELGNNKLAATDGASINVWNLTTHTLEQKITGEQTGWPKKHLCALCTLPNQQLVSADELGEIQIWSLATEKRLHTIVAHTNRILSLIPLPDNRFASCSTDGTIKIWDSTTGVCQNSFNTVASATGICVLLPDNKLASVSSHKLQKGAVVQVWDLKTGSCTQRIETPSKPLKATVLPDGRIALASYDYATVEILDIQEKETKKILLKNPTNASEDMEEVYLLGILADGRLVTSLENGTLHIWR